MIELSRLHKTVKMNNILVATDFSKNCEAAILYSLKLAQTFNAEVELFNSFVTVPAIGIDGGPGIVNETVTETGMKSHKETLAALIQSLPEEYKRGISIKATVTSGDPVYCICDYVDHNEIDLVVMGTHGESRLEEILFGSTTVDVMRQAKCPVLAIPPDAKYRGIKKIVYASDLEEKDIETIKHLCELAAFFDSEVVVFHVFSEDNLTNQEEANEFTRMLNKEVHYEKLKKESVTYGNTHDAILDVIKKDLANLIVMREQERGIFYKLFHVDMVKRINFHTTIPLLAYNDNSL